MILIIVVAAAAFIYTLYRSIASEKQFGIDVMCVLMCGFFAVLGAILGAIISFMIALALPADIERVSTEYQIEALQDNAHVSGNFFLGTGSVGGEMKYVMYLKRNGSYQLKTVDINAKIIYSDGPPFLRVIHHVHTDSFINWFAIDLIQDEYEIYVPQGTILNNYVLDAK